MGVSGSGKTTVGRRLAERLSLPFFDGDDFHPKENRAKMASGRPLNDDDRRPWLESLAELIRDHLQPRARGAVVGCSALKASYRRLLGFPDPGILWVHLSGSRELLAERLRRREGHFMPADLLDSQLTTLEAPQDGVLTLSIEATPEELCSEIVANLAEPAESGDSP